jgi:GNAT superfamily N-acetyltransferase
MMKRLYLTRPLLVRFARMEDAKALHAACFPEQTFDWVADYLRWCLDAPERPARLVAWLNHELVGHLELARRQDGSWAELSSLIVKESHRGKGIGHRMVRAAVRLVNQWDCHEVRLQVLENDQELINMYSNWGFRLRGRPLGGYCWLTHPISPPEPQPTVRTFAHAPVH